ncbi:RluA family pseudouridine synthase [Moraxella pluranimalium]|uniref:Pseudouridine synthase n=1 Tax=Moraxella pluranimalium TaxID=470453 RepID=A0A1T0CL00_9GAMM|nr:RluA family pseudouridine synthase [Moraxella pluranimalium]OOS23017.1 pseudouridine synthase [Moraxella pluranimalium]
MLNYTKSFAKRLQKFDKTMKNLQKSPKNQPSSHRFGKNSPKSRPSARPSQAKHNPHPKQSADVAISNFNQVNFLTVTDNQAGQRIDNFLLARLKGLPRSHLYKLIRADEVRINGKRCKPHDKLDVGDVVRIAPIRLSVREEVIISDSFAKGLMARIIHEDDGLIVLNKPSGMAVHGGSGESFGVIEAMRQATGKKYLELVHRIDKDTSGLLLIAKKRSTLKHLQEQFRQKTIHKQYLCLSAGYIKADSQTIDVPLLRYTLDNGERRVKVAKLGAAQGEEVAKPSLTQIKVLARFELDGKPVSLVLAMPATGRTHQIRVHMAHIGHALLGDDKYQLNKSTPQVKRLCLHAWRLSLADVAMDDDRPLQYLAPLPSDMADLLPDSVQIPA